MLPDIVLSLARTVFTQEDKKLIVSSEDHVYICL